LVERFPFFAMQPIVACRAPSLLLNTPAQRSSRPGQQILPWYDVLQLFVVLHKEWSDIAMIMRPLARNEIATIWTIDRSEVHHHVYQMQDGQLVLTPAYFDVPGWASEQVEHDTPLLYQTYDHGGTFLGMFDEHQLVGVAVVDTVLLGVLGDQVQLKYLYVSRTYRHAGVGTRLFEAAREVARTRKAKFLYISATPTENTVNFYLRRGCRVATPADPGLLALEPDDIHLVCAV
jgi:GNAT superfamily N-acetyltransferase